MWTVAFFSGSVGLHKKEDSTMARREEAIIIRLTVQAYKILLRGCKMCYKYKHGGTGWEYFPEGDSLYWWKEYRMWGGFVFYKYLYPNDQGNGL